MAVRYKLVTKGFEEYLEMLAAAGRDIDAIADEALEAGGVVLLDGMKRRVPKDTHNLEDHLVATAPEQDGNYHYIEVGLDKNADADTARYGNVQEFGSSSCEKQPYLRPTIDEDMGKARRAMKNVFVERGAL
jgi:HK97 gp10 family phage protein